MHVEAAAERLDDLVDALPVKCPPHDRRRLGRVGERREDRRRSGLPQPGGGLRADGPLADEDPPVAVDQEHRHRRVLHDEPQPVLGGDLLGHVLEMDDKVLLAARIGA
ncbi:hypothetical protein [Frankia tisae]|uniref:hypothetical protein n=1 Tax=Frankia tisae TaxID=2950104 RepID=UPI0021C0DE25|nr:hypothetical protein [Frankia tisae]